MPLVCRRGALMQQCVSGAMVAVFADEDTLMPLARQFELDLAANNGTQHTVFSGPEARLAVFCATLSQHDINYRRLSVTGAAHSALLEPILDRFQDACAGLHAEPGQIPIISTLTADVIDESTLNQADYWRRHMRQPVRFIQSIQVAHQLGARVFLEMGPDAQLVACGQREYRDNAYWIASARRNKRRAMSSIRPCSSFTLPASPYRGPTCWRAMDNVSLRHVIRLILNVTGKSASPRPASLPTQRCLPGWRWRVAPRQRSISLAWKRLNSAPRDCTPSTSINWYNAVPAMPLRTAWTP